MRVFRFASNAMTQRETIEQHINRLHAHGIIDLHFDLPMDLYENRERENVLESEFLPQFDKGNIGVIGTAIYIEDRYLPDKALAVALGQIARLQHEVASNDRFAICKSFGDIRNARAADKIAFLITMEGVEPLGADLDMLGIFYTLGLRSIGLTHARRNAAASGAIFAASGSPSDGLTRFGAEVVRQCESLGIIIDLAHINPAGFNEVIDRTTKPLIVSHTNARRFYDIERNISDEQIKLIGERRGVIGINSVLVSPNKEESTLDRYVDHISHVSDLIGIDCVGIGFDFFEFIYEQWSESQKQELADKHTTPHFIPGLQNHSHASNLTRKLIERGFGDQDIEKILFRNWMRMFEEIL